MKRLRRGWFLRVLTAAFFVGICRGQAQQSLPFTNLASVTTANIQGHVSSNLVTVYSTTTNEERSFKGVFSASTAGSKLAIHSDDGCTVKVDGVAKVSKFGVNTHLQDLSTSFNQLSSSFIVGDYGGSDGGKQALV